MIMTDPVPVVSANTSLATLRLALTNLKFAPSVEAEYRLQQTEQNRMRLRTGSTFLLWVLIAFMGADIYRLKGAIQTGEWAHLGGILTLRALPLIVVVSALLLHGPDDRGLSDRVLRRLTAAGLCLLGLSTLGVLVLHFSRPDLSQVPFSLNGMLLVIMAFFFPAGIPYRHALAMAIGLAGVTTFTLALTLPASAIPAFYVFVPYLWLTLVIAGGSGLMHDLAQRNQFLLEGQLRHAAERDGLTALYNRRTFMLLLEHAVATSHRTGSKLSLLVIDIDHFKAYNDGYGHPAGDAALKSVSAALTQVGKRDVDFCARLGGEEFAVVLFGADENQACRMADAFRLAVVNELAITHNASPTNTHLSVSVGVAGLTPGLCVANLYKNADDALYSAKNTGRNKVAHYVQAAPITDKSAQPVEDLVTA